MKPIELFKHLAKEIPEIKESKWQEYAAISPDGVRELELKKRKEKK